MTITSTEPRHLGIPLLSAALLFVGLSSPGAGETIASIGRMQRNTSDCVLRVSSRSQQRCRQVQLDRKTESVLRIRFIGASETEGVITSLSFVSADPSTPLPLRCTQGRCQLQGSSHWEGPVLGASESFTNSLGITIGVPKAWAARGVCRVSQVNVICKATRSDGLALRAEAWF